LIHAAWQEHAAALLRELLLISIDEGAPATFQEHAGASDAMNLLAEQVPVLELGPEPEAIMSAAVEPSVSMRSLPLRVPRSSVASFAVLDAMLSHATALAEAGALLATPTQPEVVELRQWICSQVHHQSTGETAAEPWSLRADVLQPADVAFDAGWDPQATTDSPRARLAMDEHGIIVAVSRSAATLLGYQEQSELIGHRIIRIVPPRYHQAHIGGMTLHLTNGRSPLLGRRLAVPVVKQDGTEVTVTLLVEPHLLPGGHRLFFADFAAPGTTNEPPQVSSEGSRQAGTAPTA
jgi:PAS domain S-box-containing protein